MTRYHVWVHVEEETDDETYADMGLPEKLATFETEAEALAFVCGIDRRSEPREEARSEPTEAPVPGQAAWRDAVRRGDA